MAEKTEGLIYRNHPLRRVGKMIYYGSMADSHIILMQVKEQAGKRSGDCHESFRGIAAHRSGSEKPGPGCKAQREGQPVRRHGYFRHLAGEGSGRQITAAGGMGRFKN